MAAGTLHQGILALFRGDPWLAFDILGVARPVNGTPVDRRGEVELDGKEPLTVRQGFPDLVMVYQDPDDAERGAVITIEAQKDPDRLKRWRIPVYQALLAEDYELPTWAVVVSFAEKMSELLRSWRDGPPPKVDVLLLDVDTVERSWLDDPEQRPAAAVLAAALHGHAGDVDAARVGLRATLAMPEKHRRRHAMTVLAALPKHQRDALIGELPMHQRDELLDIERESGTYHLGLQEGLEQGLEQGRAEGRRLALVELIFDLLSERGVIVDGDTEVRIRSCEDLAALRRWARHAGDVSSLAELFGRA